jgi:uncharacterized protein YgiM (DUF1202 family)
MKKNVFLLIIITVFLLSGCSKKEKMTNFIPTMAPEDEITSEVTQTPLEGSTEATPTPKEIHVGETTTKYVKLSEYDDTLNVRSTPSTDSEPVGFLVHTEKIEVIDIVDGWASFVYNNQVCYVNADFLVD